jgi:putative phage-type endonuclease
VREGLSRKEWLERRRQYIGGSDAAAALGISRFKTRLQLCLDKWGEVNDEPTEVMRRGTILEPLVARLYQDGTGHQVEAGPWCVSDDHPFMAATPDLIDVELDCIVQLKTASVWGRHLWGEHGTDEIPDDYMCQAQHEMAVTGALSNVFAVLFADDSAFRGLVYMAKSNLPVAQLCEFVNEMIAAKDSKVEFSIFPIKRDAALIGTLVAGEADFWNNYVLPHATPPDASIPEKEPTIITADRKQSAILEKYFAAREDESHAKELVAQWRTQIQTMIGEKAGISANGVGKITYKAPTPTKKTDFETVALAMKSSDPDKYAVLEKKHTKTVQAARRFIGTPAK